jgi:hypothetical protein
LMRNRIFCYIEDKSVSHTVNGRMFTFGIWGKWNGV